MLLAVCLHDQTVSRSISAERSGHPMTPQQRQASWSLAAAAMDLEREEEILALREVQFFATVCRCSVYGAVLTDHAVPALMSCVQLIVI